MPSFTGKRSEVGSKPPPRIAATASSSSSDDDDNGELAREMAQAANALRRKNPHGELGRAVAPRENPLARRVPQPPQSAAEGVSGKREKASASRMADLQAGDSFPRGMKLDLFADDSDDAGRAKAASDKVASNWKSAIIGNASDASGGGSDADADSAVDDEVLHINQSYATRFEEVKRKQELQRLTEKYATKLESVMRRKKKAAASGDGSGDDSGKGDDNDFDRDSDDSSDGEPEDDDAVLLTEENELAFAESLLAVRKAAAAAAAAGKSGPNSHATGKTETVKEGYLERRYFPPAEEQMKRNSEIFEKALLRKKLEKKKFTLKDEYQRAVETTAVAADADEVADGPADNGSGLRKLKPQSSEERALRKAFLASVADSAEVFDVKKKAADTEGGNGEQNDGDGANRDGTPGSARAAAALGRRRRELLEEAFRIDAANGVASRTITAGGDAARTKNTSDISGNAPTAVAPSSEEEVFIRDFFLHELWRGHDSDEEDGDNTGIAGGSKNYAKTLAELAQAEEDEAFYNDADVWEREYQEKKYRHEEAEEAAHIQTFPRPIGEAAGGLLRKVDTTRKDARQRRAERLEAARKQQVEELKRLKHLKRQEIEDQRALIAAVAGITKRKKKNVSAKTVGEETEHSNKKGSNAASGRDNSKSQGDLQKPTWSDEDEDEDEAVRRLKSVWTEQDLDAPFNPEEFDKKMAQLFDEEYYKAENVDDDEIAYMEAELDNVDVDEAGDVSGSRSKARRGATAADAPIGSEDDESNEEEDSMESHKKASATSRAKFAALAAEPDLFRASSLEEARQLAQQQRNKGVGSTDTNGSGTAKTEKKQDGDSATHFEDEDETLFFSDLFGPDRGRKARPPADATDSDNSNDDTVALLYPSASLQHLEKAVFNKRQEIDRLLAERENSSPTSGDADKHNGNGKGEENQEVLLQRLQAELKKKEEEYYKLHHDRTIGGGELKMRFRYREVEPEDFTLSVEEILARDDRQLNMIAPMNCYAAYLDRASNLRDRHRIERRRIKGFRELDTDRSSRRYGAVAKTVILNPTEITEEEGEALAQRLRKRVREEGGGDGNDFSNAVDRQRGRDRGETDGSLGGGRGRGGAHLERGRGDFRGGFRRRGSAPRGGNGSGASNSYRGGGYGRGAGGFNRGDRGRGMRGGGSGGPLFGGRGRGN